MHRRTVRQALASAVLSRREPYLQRPGDARPREVSIPRRCLEPSYKQHTGRRPPASQSRRWGGNAESARRLARAAWMMRHCWDEQPLTRASSAFIASILATLICDRLRRMSGLSPTAPTGAGRNPSLMPLRGTRSEFNHRRRSPPPTVPETFCY